MPYTEGPTRSELLSFRCTPEEKAAYAAAAWEARCSLSEWARSLCEERLQMQAHAALREAGRWLPIHSQAHADQVSDLTHQL